jgi:hypothetical protein
LLSLKTFVNVTAVSNKQRNIGKKNLFFVGISKAADKKSIIRIRNPVYGSKDPDPYQNITDLYALALGQSLLVQHGTRGGGGVGEE